MTNAKLREQARHTYWQNRGQMWLLFTLVTIVNFAWLFFQRYIFDFGSVSTVLGILYSLAIMPVTTFGLMHVLLGLIRRQKVKVSMVFDMYKPPHNPLKVYAAGVVLLSPALLILLISMIKYQLPATIFGAMFLFILLLCAFGFILWLRFRLFLFPFLIVTKQDEPIGELIAASFQKMKGNVRHLLWYGITVSLPVIIVIIVFIVLTIQNIYEPDTLATLNTLSGMIAVLLAVFVDPYIELALAGYANNLLKTEAE